MKKYLLLLIAVLTMTFVGCDHEDEEFVPNYVTFESTTGDFGVDIEGSATYDVTVYAANTIGQDRTIDIMVDTSSTIEAAGYSVPATVTIPANSNEAMFTLEVSEMDFGANGETLVLQLQPQAGLSVGSPMTLTVTPLCPFPETSLDIVFDDWASETTWEIEDSEGNVLFTGGGYGDGLGTANRMLCLEAGDYTFNIYDSYGDGLTSPETGSVTISYDGEELVSFDGDYAEGTSVDFTIE